MYVFSRAEMSMGNLFFKKQSDCRGAGRGGGGGEEDPLDGAGDKRSHQEPEP